MPFVSLDFDLDFAADGADGDRLDDLSGAWTYYSAVSAAVLERQSPYLVSTATGGGQPAFYSAPMSDPDDAIEATFRLSTLTDASSYVLGARFQLATLEGYMVFWSASAEAFRLQRQQSGSTTLDEWAPPSPAPGDSFTCRLQATGSTLRVYIDGVLRMEAVDATYASGAWVVFATGPATASVGQVLRTLRGGEWSDAAPEYEGELGASLPALTAALPASYHPPVSGEIAATLPTLSAALAGTVEPPPAYEGEITASLPTLSASLTGTTEAPAAYSGTLDAALSALTAELTGAYVPPVTGPLDATLQPLSANLTGVATEPGSYTGTLAATLEPLTAAFTGTYEAPAVFVGQLDATLEPLTAQLTGTFELFPYALRIDHLDVPLQAHGGRTLQKQAPMPEVHRGVRGRALSGIRANVWRHRVWQLATTPLEPDATKALCTHLTTAPVVQASGFAVGGVVEGVVTPGSVRASPDTSLRYSVSFELRETQRPSPLTAADYYARVAGQENLVQVPDFSANWALTRSVLTDDQPDPHGGNAAALLAVANGELNGLAMNATIEKPTEPRTYVASLWARADGRDWLRLRFADTLGAKRVDAYFGLATGTVGTVNQNAFASVAVGILPRGDGWHQCIIVGTTDNNAGVRLQIYPAGADSNPSAPDNDGTRGILLWRPEIIPCP